jgi:hypothetical protein
VTKPRSKTVLDAAFFVFLGISLDSTTKQNNENPMNKINKMG